MPANNDWQKKLLDQCQRQEDRDVINFAFKNCEVIKVFCLFKSVHLRDIYITDGKIQFEGRKLEISEK